MKPDRVYRSVLALFGFALVCTVMSAARWPVVDLSPLWAACCRSLRMVVGNEAGSWLSRFTLVGVVGLLTFGLAVLVSRLRKTRRFVARLRSVAVNNSPARLAQLTDDLSLSPYVVVLATEVPLVFCYGLLRPRIAISTGLVETLTDKELNAVLLHEDHHRRHHDPLRGLLAEVLAAMFFFLPMAAEWRDLFLTRTELEADRHAVRIAGRPSLAGALHKLLTDPLTTRLALPGITGLSATETRIAELLGDRSPHLRISAHSLMTSSLIIMLGCMLAL